MLNKTYEIINEISIIIEMTEQFNQSKNVLIKFYSFHLKNVLKNQFLLNIFKRIKMLFRLYHIRNIIYIIPFYSG